MSLRRGGGLGKNLKVNLKFAAVVDTGHGRTEWRHCFELSRHLASRFDRNRNFLTNDVPIRSGCPLLLKLDQNLIASR